MKQVDHDAAMELMLKIKTDLKTVIDNYAVEAANLSINSDERLTPVIGCVQMAFANAAADYFTMAGMRPQEVVATVLQYTNMPMVQWVSAVVKANTMPTPREKKQRKRRTH